MASDTLTSIQYSLLRQENKLKDLTQRFHKSPVMGLLNDGNKVTTIQDQGGRGLIRYFNDTVYPSGGFSQVAAGGDYAPAQIQAEIQPYIALQLYGLSVSYQEHALKALETGGRKAVMQSVRSKLKAAVNLTQDRMGRQIMMRGDGIVARADAAGSSETTVSSSIPLGLVVGDIVYARKDSSGDGRGLTGSLDVNGIRVTGVDYINNDFTLASAQSWDDDDVFYILNAANNASGAGVYLHGLQAMCDNPVGDTSQWDADDDASYDHVDTYLGQTRSSTPLMNITWHNGNSKSPDFNMFANMANIAMSYGAEPDKLWIIIHPTTWQAYSDTVSGFARRSTKIKLPGGTYTVPVVDGTGQTELKVAVDWSMPTDKIILLDTSRYYKLSAPGGWNKRTGKMWNRNAVTGSGSAGSAFTAVFDIWQQVALNGANTSVVAYDVTTT